MFNRIQGQREIELLQGTIMHPETANTLEETHTIKMRCRHHALRLRSETDGDPTGGSSVPTRVLVSTGSGAF